MEPGRNVVLITVDSLRADFCGFLGADRDTTPELSRLLADDGVVFESAVAPGPSTHESMPTIFAGSRPSAAGHGLEKRAAIRQHLAAHKRIPEVLTAQGYAAAGFTPNPFTSRDFGYGSGWNEFEDFLADDGLLGSLRSSIVNRWLEGRFVAGLRFGLNMVGRGDISMPWQEIVPAVHDAAADLPEPFFLWVFLLDPHWPYQPSTEHRRIPRWRQWRANWEASSFSDATPSNHDDLVELYAGTIRDVDACAAALDRELSAYDPVFVLHADHGEAFGERSDYGHLPVLYEENIHVPWVVWNADRGSERVDEPAPLRNLPRLLADVGAGDFDPSTVVRPVAHARSEWDHAVVRGRSWKLYARPGEGVALVDLDADPGEQNPRSVDDAALRRAAQVSNEHVAEVDRLRDSVRGFESGCGD